LEIKRTRSPLLKRTLFNFLTAKLISKLPCPRSTNPIPTTKASPYENPQISSPPSKQENSSCTRQQEKCNFSRNQKTLLKFGLFLDRRNMGALGSKISSLSVRKDPFFKTKKISFVLDLSCEIMKN
jgi:hypothetical protein